VIEVIVVAECGSELSQIWTASNGIPNPDLEGSGEVSAMCSTPKERSRNPGFLRWAAASTRKPARSSCARADGTGLHTEGFGHEDSHPTAGLPVPARRVGLRRVAQQGVPTDTSVDFDAEGLQFAVQRRTGDTEGCCGLHTVPAGLAQCQDDRVSLD
jgi:hypothetical protein